MRPLTGEQQSAVDADMDSPLAVVAGAGSGKTETLTRRVARAVLECGVAPERVLVLTFSNKAARELRERLRGLLGVDADRVAAHTSKHGCVYARLEIPLLQKRCSRGAARR